MDLFFLRFRTAIAEFVAPLFSFRMKEGAWYDKRDLVELSLHAAVMNGFAEGIANSLRRQGKIPTSETLLDYIKAMSCDEMLANAEAQIESCINQLRLKGLRLKDVGVAFDWHDQPYYGKPTPGMVGAQPKRGTCYAFSFLTASILTPRRRLVLCIIPLTSREGLSALVLGLIARVQKRVEGIGYVAFDNGFQDSELVKELQNRRIPFIIPLRDTMKLKRRWRWMRYARRFNYTTQGVEVEMVEAQDAKGRRYFLATNMGDSPKRVLRLYKRRWGIETSYRKIGEFLPKTTSRRWVVRVFYFIFACLIYNAWVLLNAKAQETLTTIMMKLNYVWHSLTLHQMEIEASPG